MGQGCKVCWNDECHYLDDACPEDGNCSKGIVEMLKCKDREGD